MNRKLILSIAALTATAALGFQAVRQAARPRAIATLSSITPQGALLTIESPDFAAVLRSWNQSAQQKAWLASDNYAVFSNSRLLGRLSDARTEFEGAIPDSKNSTASFDADFLTQIAGRQSLFAWYDVGNLEFLYITRMSPAQAAKIALIQSHAHWTARQSGGTTFYLRKTTSEGTPRTVAYAQLPTPSGDTLLLLATREDLLAQSLALIQTPGASVDHEPWYTDAITALGPEQTKTSPILHMVLNLDRLVPLPAFRTYWIQQNVTQMKQYRSAVSDLYTTSTEFREERTLLLKSPQTEPGNPILFNLIPQVPGVYRATATHSPAVAITALEEKLLGRAALEKLADKDAPDPTLSAPQSGSAADLETRIDTPAPVSATFSNQALADTLKSANFDAVLTYSTAAQTEPGTLWIPIHNAVLLHAATAWNAATLQSALQQSLRGGLSTGTLGIEFRALPGSNSTIFQLTGPKRLYLATRANLAILTDDQPLLQTLLAQPAPASAATPATLLAGFDHASQRVPYARLTSLIDGNNQAKSADNPAVTEVSEPSLFFSRNMKSLSDAFAALASERFLETPIDTPAGPALHQTVTYQWK
jgi:hypothetical protein